MAEGRAEHVGGRGVLLGKRRDKGRWEGKRGRQGPGLMETEFLLQISFFLVPPSLLVLTLWVPEAEGPLRSALLSPPTLLQVPSGGSHRLAGGEADPWPFDPSPGESKEPPQCGASRVVRGAAA